MKYSPEVCCVVCQLIFCCPDCRRKHEETVHGLTYDCPICRGNQFLCKPEELSQQFIKHLYQEHSPLQCKKCHKYFTNMEDFTNISECKSISELVNIDNEVNNSQLKKVEEKFDSIYDKTKSVDIDNFEAIVSVDKVNKTAVITPVVRKKHIVDYDSSESETDEEKTSEAQKTSSKLAPKTPKLKRQRAATPHAKKLLSLMKQKVVEEYEETVNDDDYDGSPVTTKTTPSRSENSGVPDNQKEMTTPTSHIPHNLLKLAQIVTTSTPTHPVVGGWSIFPEQSADSPLSEIENTESPAQSIGNEPSKSENIAPKLKSIIVSGSRIRLGSQDSSEKHVTFQESVNITDVSSVKIKKVKFAEDTVFEQENKAKRVYRKPKRMLTPGPQRPRFCLNPRFQALVNRFENQGQTVARTPVHNKEKTPESTPAIGEPTHMPARAIIFNEESLVVDTGNYSKESNELFKTCSDSPTSSAGVNTALSALTTNIAGSLQNCLASVLKSSGEDTEIQFQFVITKKTMSVKRIVEEGASLEEKCNEIEKHYEANKENIWSSVAKAVKNVFWGDQDTATTPFRSSNNDSDSSSASKRKCNEMTDPELSPLNHKRHRYDGRIRGRPPLRRSKTWGVSNLRSSQSAEQQSLLKEVSVGQDDAMNQSF
ncbi:uncharacterized protein LOC114362667 [Ostrinia furnacalis]|uniref:uncharacterized protein LOC114362667 n=1 Tax=Ostrinia furnacalis TaxID=93504 RepID=UPI00103ACBA5|nr:uncharacterized protein LOC114362667 [Ostrinia furnacalis]